MAPACRLLVLALLLLPAPRVLAQAAEDPAGPATEPVESPGIDPSMVGVETIEVIGEQENAADVQDEAQAISAFSAEDLDKANIVNIDSLAFGVPGLHVGQAGQEAIVTLRGIGTENASITGEPGVAFHVDGVNYSQPAAARVAFFDFETLDVKLGPQGLMGGKNSTSGTINVVTKKPTDEFEISGDFLSGNYDRIRARGILNVPFGEIAAARVAFFHETRDGYLDNPSLSSSKDPFDADDFGMRAHFRVNPADSLELLFSYNYFQQGGSGPQADLVPVSRSSIPCDPPSGSVEYVPNPRGPTTLPEIAVPTKGPPGNDAGPSVMPILAACHYETDRPGLRPNGLPDSACRDPNTGRPRPCATHYVRVSEDPDPRGTLVDFPSSQDNRFWGWTTHADWDVPELPALGETHLALIGGFQRSEQLFDQDADGTNLPFTNTLSDRGAYQYSSELQWSGMIGERFAWHTGGIFSRERGYRDLDRPATRINDIRLFIEQETENKSYGTWLSGTFDASDSVRLSLGGRWVKDTKRSYLLRGSPQLGEPKDRYIGCEGVLGDSGTGPAKPNPWCGQTFRGTLWGAGIDFRPEASENHLLYARMDRGFKSGGFRAGGRGTYKPEKNWAYSAGMKNTLFDGRLQLNLDGFVYLYQDMQIVVFDEVSLRTENTEARMYGWDLRATFMPLEGLRLEALVSNLHTETIDYFTLDPGGVDIFGSGAGDPTLDPFQVAQYNSARLGTRDRTENYEPEDRGGLNYADSPTCITGPPTFLFGVECGTTGDRNGLDDFSGNQLSRSPEWKLTLSGEYEIPLGRFGSLTPRVQYSWTDETYFRAFNREFDLQEAYHLTDAKLTWRSPEQRWDVEAFVQNIENEAPKQNLFIGARSNGAPPIVWWGPPRFYGLRVGFKY